MDVQHLQGALAHAVDQHVRGLLDHPFAGAGRAANAATAGLLGQGAGGFQHLPRHRGSGGRVERVVVILGVCKLRGGRDGPVTP